MSTKKQIFSLCKLHSIYEEIPEKFFDVTDVDNYFHHKILDISQSHNRIVRVSKGSNNKSLHPKCFNFAIQSYSSDLFSRKKTTFPKKQIESLLDSLGEFLKAFDEANKVSQIPLRKPKFEIGFTKAKNELFSHCYKDIVEHLNRQIRLSFRFDKNKNCVLSIKKFEQYGDQFILTEVVNLSYREIKHLYKNRFFVANKCDIFESLQCVVHPPLIMGMTIALLFSLGKCIVQIQSVWVNFVCTKRYFNLSAEPIIIARNAHLCARLRNIPIEDQTNPFFLSLGQGVYIFEENPKTIQDVIGNVYCPGEYCLNRETCKSIGGYVTTLRSIFGCDHCGAWLFVHKVYFTLQKHSKTIKTDKTRFFFAKKDGTRLTIFT